MPFDPREPIKRAICLKLIKQVPNSEIGGAVFNQVLGEGFYATTRKFRLSSDQAFTIVNGFEIVNPFL
jgi:predicted nucleic acid-binding protein